MVKIGSSMEPRIYEACCGGQGIAEVIDLLTQGEVYRQLDTLAFATLLPGNSIGEHMHTDEMEAYVILKGKGIFCDNGTDVLVEPMDVTITYSGETHSIRPAPDSQEPLELMAVIIKR